MFPQELCLRQSDSSGTTGQKTSKIVLDERTAAWQQQTLQRIMADFIGEKRIPMLIIDAPNVLRDRALFSAREPDSGIFNLRVKTLLRVEGRYVSGS